MDDMLVKVLTTVVTAAVSAALGWILSALRRSARRDRNMEHGMRILLRGHLEVIYRASDGGRQPLSLEQKKDAEETHAVYEAMGGNGIGTMMWMKIMNAPTVSKE